MTLVLARRRSNKTLEGHKVEFAKDATGELRSTIDSTVSRLGALTPRQYEPSLRIVEGEYLAVPDELIRRAAPPLPTRIRPSRGEPGDRAIQGGALETADDPIRDGSAPVGEDSNSASLQIETDPEVRRLLTQASGLPKLSATALRGKPFQFYAVVLGSQPEQRTAFVRKHGPTTSLGSGRMLFAHGDRLTRVSEPLLALDRHFDLVVTPDGIAVLNQPVFDDLFRDAETLVNRYPKWATAFSSLDLTDSDTSVIVERCRRDSRLANRVRMIFESGHLAAGGVKVDDVLTQADMLGIHRKSISESGKLDFSKPDLATLLKLLNDDLFVGGLSKVPFEAGSKHRQRKG